MRHHRYQWPPRLSYLRCGQRGRWIVLTTVVALAAAGCSELKSGTTLEDRATEYLELKRTKRWEEVYDRYLDPEIKGSLSREAFLKKRLLAFNVLSYSIKELREDGNEGTVSVSGEANIPVRGVRGAVRMIQKEIAVEDRWVKRDGVWYVRLAR